MGRNVAFYVSGHGYGHAARVAEVMRALAAREPGWRLHVRTAAPRTFFPSSVAYGTVAVDAGAAERGPLHIDAAATLGRAAALLAGKSPIIQSEVAFIHKQEVSLVVADAPHLAGEIAAAGVPCVAVTNFTWDWIYEPFVRDAPGPGGLLEEVRRGYRMMAALLRLPFADERATAGLFREVTDVPLLARRGETEPADVLRTAGLDPRDPRARVLIGMRGGVPDGALEAAAAASPDMLFVTLDEPAGGARANVRPAAVGADLTFVDLLRACDVVVSKLGYGIVADCIANGTALLFPPRQGFREDELTRERAPAFMRLREIPPADYESGAWSAPLRSLLDSPAPPGAPATDGAEVCAALLSRWL